MPTRHKARLRLLPLDEPISLFSHCEDALTATRGQGYAAYRAMGESDFIAGCFSLKKPMHTGPARALTDAELLAVLSEGPAALQVAA